jgi:uncharacterized protein YjbI with pentapeptide repeats
MTMRNRTAAAIGAVAVLGLAAGLTVTAAPALAATCPSVNSSTGQVTPAPAAGVDWSGCDLSGAYLPAAEMAGASLQNANLTRAYLPNADLDGADLSGATGTSATMAGASLSGANLTSAGLMGANLSSTQLTSAVLDNAYAWGAKFIGAIMKGASLQGTDLDSADLSSANLFGATGQIASDVDAQWFSTICQNGASANYYSAGCFSAVAVTTPAATPTITGGTLGTNGWYTSGVTVSWYWVDSQSIDPAQCPPTTTGSQQGSAVTISGSCTDSLASTGTSSVVMKIDTTPPAVALTGLVNNGTYPLGKAPTPACTTADALSGVALHAGELISGGQPDGAGVFTVTCSGGQDNAGNIAALISAHFTVVYEFGGFLAPKVGGTLKSSAKTISVRFRLTNGSGTPIGTTYSAALAARHDVRATLRGPGIKPVIATCVWKTASSYFGCPIPMPAHVETGSKHTYTITVTENLGRGFVTAPIDAASENPAPIHFS